MTALNDSCQQRRAFLKSDRLLADSVRGRIWLVKWRGESEGAGREVSEMTVFLNGTCAEHRLVLCLNITRSQASQHCHDI